MLEKEVGYVNSEGIILFRKQMSNFWERVVEVEPDKYRTTKTASAPACPLPPPPLVISSYPQAAC